MLTQWLGSVLLFAGLLISVIAVDRECSEGVLDGTDKETNTVRCGLRNGTRCITGNWECDEMLDCSDGSDEFICGFWERLVYVYDYSGHLYFPHTNITMHIKTKIKLMKIDDDFLMKFQDPVLSRSKTKPTNLLSGDEIAAWKMDLKFKSKDNGMIENIYYESGHPEDILNMKKAIVSIFQLRLETKDGNNLKSHKYKNVETDVTGKCRVSYETEREAVKTPGKSIKTLYKINVTKINDYTDCEERPFVVSQDMDTVKCDELPGSKIPKSRMMTSCTIYILEDKLATQAVINHCESHERQEFEFQRKSGDSPLVIVTVRKELQLQKIIAETHNTHKSWSSKSSILFNFDGLYQKEVKSSQENLDEVKKTLDRLHQLVNQETKAWDLISAEAPSLYSKLISQLRWKVDKSTFKDIYQQYYNLEKYRTWLESALPFVGSDASGEEIKDKIESGSISGMSAVKLLSRLGVVKSPTKAMCEDIMDLCQKYVVTNDSTVHSTCWLAFGSLVHSYCKEKSTCPDLFIETLKQEHDTNLHTQDHHANVIKDNEKLVVALKAIGNSGQKRLLPQLLNITTTWDDNNAIMIAAIEATRRMVLDDADSLKVQQALRNIFVNRNMCPEIRMVAFEELINTGPNTADILMSLANTMRTEVNPKMKQFVYTFLDTESKLKCLAKRSRKTAIDLLSRTANLPRPSFELRYSFSKSFSFGIPGIINQGFNIESVHSSMSAIPRFLKLNNYMTLLGHYWEQMEHKVRQREVAPLLRELFGPHGMIEEKKSLWDFMRGKRSADSDGFPEVYKRMEEMLNPSTVSDLPFKMTLSSKMYGSEIVYLVLNESLTFIQNLRKDGTIKVDKDWWTNSLKAGFRFNMSANDILFNAMRKIPTSIGLPLKMKTNTAGIFAYGLYVDAKTSPMFNLLSWSNKPTDISANYKESYSLSTYTNAMAYVFYRDLKLGYVMHQNMSNRLPVPIEKLTLSGQIPNQTYSIGVVMSKKKYVFSESSNTFNCFVKLRDDYIKYDKVDWKAPQVSVTPGLGLHAGGKNPGGQTAGMGSGFQFPGMGKPPSGGQSQSQWGPGASDGQADGPGIPMPGEPCIGALNNSMKVCFKTDAKTSVQQLWYDPNERIIEEIQIKYQNITEESDKEWKFLGEFHVNGKNNTKIAEYHMELNLTSATNRPMLWDPTRGGQGADFGGFSAKAYEVKRGAKTYMACMKSKVDVPGMRWDVGVKWGKSCQEYSINMSTVLYYNGGDPNVNISLKWDSLPAMVERLTCPAKYIGEAMKKMQEQMKKMQEQMEKMKKLNGLGSNAGMGGQGGGPGGMAGGMDRWPSGLGGAAGGKGTLPGGMSGTAGGMGSWPSGTSEGAGGMGALPNGMGGGGIGALPNGMGGGSMGALPNGMGSVAGGMDSLPCLKSLGVTLSLKNATTIEVAATMLPTPFTYKLPFNGTKAFEMTKEIILFGITETCTVDSTDEITTFDKKTFTYHKSKGCTHVLAKDCSKKNLFTVFSKKDERNKTIYTLVVKDKKSRGHVFVINPNLTVTYDGKLLQFNGSQHIHHGCRVTIKESRHLVIRCEAGVTLVASSGDLKIKVTPWYFTYMCGMCGDYNWEAYDDFTAPQDFREETNNEAFGTSWLVPGDSCNSECKIVHRPDIYRPKDKLCISTSPITRCAPHCQPTRQASSKRAYRCLDNGTDEATKVEQQISTKKFDEIMKAFGGRKRDLKAEADVHVDCQCTCPAHNG